VTGENDDIRTPRRTMMPPRSHLPPMGDNTGPVIPTIRFMQLPPPNTWSGVMAAGQPKVA
jgi:hypothetical protein